MSGSSLVGTTFKVQIADTTYEPHSFVFSKDNGNWSAPIRITGEQQQLPGEDLYLRFSNTVGWTKLARWIITATSSSATLTSSPAYREHEYCGGRAMCDFTNGYCDGCTGNSLYVARGRTRVGMAHGSQRGVLQWRDVQLPFLRRHRARDST